MPHEPLAPWRPAAPSDALHWLEACPPLWWLAGGWAVDAFLGAPTRPHADLDVGCLRRDLRALLRAQTGWEWFEAQRGALSALAPGSVPALATNSLWGRPAREREWHLQLLLDEADGEEWKFRRAPAIRLPLAALTWRGPDDMRVLCPEVQLLYKAKAPRPQDELDFARAAPCLAAPARAWLRAALERVHPGHAWNGAL